MFFTVKVEQNDYVKERDNECGTMYCQRQGQCTAREQAIRVQYRALIALNSLYGAVAQFLKEW